MSVFDQNLADLNDYNDLIDRNGARSNDSWNINHLYTNLHLKDEPPELFDDNRFDLFQSFGDRETEELSTASTSNNYGANQHQDQMHRMLRATESPTLNLSQVIEWNDYFSNATKTENVDDSQSKSSDENDTRNSDIVRIKSESEEDEDEQVFDDGKNSTSGFSSNVELTEEVTIVKHN